MATHKSNHRLPEDLVIEILLRVPIKSLLKFRLVSKSWRRLISGPQFKQNYSETSTCRRRLMIFPWAGALVTTCPFCPKFGEHPSTEKLAKPFDLTSGDPRDRVRVVGSCNGLICILYPRTNSVFVWNPAIRKHRRLPATSSHKVLICYGFGYDESSEDHKVVEYSHRVGRRSFCSIYSLRNNSWKRLDWPQHATLRRGCRGVFVHGAIHWMVPRHDRPADLIAVNMRTEKCSSVPLPVHATGDQKRMESGLLGVSKECLCLCLPNDNKCWDVWVMQEYGMKESWTIVAYIPYYFCEANLCDLTTEALCFTEKGDVLVALASKCSSVSEFDKLRPLTANNTDKATIYAETFVDPS